MYERFEELLKKKNLRTSDVGRATHIGASTFSDWKAGRTTPKADKLILIADFLGVSVEYLTGAVDSPEKAPTQEQAKLAVDIYANPYLIELVRAAQESSTADVVFATDYLRRMTAYHKAAEALHG